MSKGLGIGPWGTTVTVLVTVWLLIGLITLTMPVAFFIWLALGAIGGFVLYFGGVRFIRWGTGKT
jgi:hypothetical protein